MEKNNIKSPWTIQDAKDGDVIFYDDGWTCIFKCIHGIWYSSYCFITSDGEFNTGYETHAVDSTINGRAHLATNKQRNLLFQKMKEAGYKWNPQTKTLVKIIEPIFKVGDKIIRIKTGDIYEIIKIIPNYYIAKYLGSEIMISFNDHDEYGLINEPKFKVGDEIKPLGSDRHYNIKNIKNDRYILNDNVFLKFIDEHHFELVPKKFDISNLKPFDKVLVRTDNKHVWSTQFFERINNRLKDSFVCMGGWRYRQCIPYEGNEHLLNTVNDCDEIYKNWK